MTYLSIYIWGDCPNAGALISRGFYFCFELRALASCLKTEGVFRCLEMGGGGGPSVDRSICTLEGIFFPYMLLVRRTLSVLPLRTPPESVNNVQTKISGLRVYSGIEHVFHVRRIMGQFADRQSRGLRAQLVTKGGRDVIHGPASLAKISCMHAWPTTLFFFFLKV